MATLKNNGSILAKHDYGTFQVAYMSNGRILKNSGTGWKKWKRWGEGADVAAKVRATVERFLMRPVTMPCWSAWRKLLIAAAPISKRWMIITTIELMPDDADGCWATFDDYRMGLSIEEVIELCAAYRAMLASKQAEFESHEATRQPTATTCNPES